MKVEIDILKLSTSRVLLMKYKDEKWRLIAFISKLLNEVERNHKFHNKKILIIIRYLETWRYFWKEAKGQFEIWTDYKNLIKAQKLNQKQAR